MAFRPPPSPTTAWSSPPASPAAKADATNSRTNCDAWTSPKSTPPRTTPPPAARSNDSSRRSKAGLPTNPQRTTIAELQTQIDAFVDEYNHRRPHRSLPHRATPATAYQPPKAAPGTRTDTHDRVRTDRVDQAGSVTLRVNGRLHHIGIGRIHYRTRVLILVQDLNIRIINAATGELLRDFVLDPTRDYQPTGAPKGPTRKKAPNLMKAQGYSDVDVVRTAAPTEAATKEYNESMKAAMPQTIWVTGCSSWYLGKDGLPELFPWTPDTHRELLRQPEPADFDVRTA